MLLVMRDRGKAMALHEALLAVVRSRMRRSRVTTRMNEAHRAIGRRQRLRRRQLPLLGEQRQRVGRLYRYLLQGLILRQLLLFILRLSVLILQQILPFHLLSDTLHHLQGPLASRPPINGRNTANPVSLPQIASIRLHIIIAHFSKMSRN